MDKQELSKAMAEVRIKHQGGEKVNVFLNGDGDEIVNMMILVIINIARLSGITMEELQEALSKSVYDYWFSATNIKEAELKDGDISN